MKSNSYLLFVKAFGSPIRLKILEQLKNSPKSVMQICSSLGFEQSKVSHNLRCLIDCGFVKNRRDGKKRIYSLNKETVVPLFKIIDKHISKNKEHLIECGVISE